MTLPKEAAGRQRLALFVMALCLAAQAPRAESAPCTTQSACSTACGGSYAFTSGSGGTSTYNSCTATSSNPCCCTSGSGYNPSCAAPASPSPAPVVSAGGGSYTELQYTVCSSNTQFSGGTGYTPFDRCGVASSAATCQARSLRGR